MKKFLTILLLSAMALTLVACATVSAAENIEVEMTTPEPDLSTNPANSTKQEIIEEKVAEITTATPKTGKVKINEFITIDYDKPFPFIIGNNSVAKPISPTNTESYEKDIAVEPEIILEGTDAIAAQIEKDMTYAEVCEILGFEGTKIDVGEVYEWNYENGDSILVNFQDYKTFVCVEHDGENTGDALRIAAKLTVGMTYAEICEILGVKGVDVGSGFLIYHF